MRLPVDYNNDCRPKMSWASFVWGEEDEEDEQDITLSSWVTVKGKDPVPSSSVQKRVKRVKNVSSHKGFSQTSVSDVWRTTATSSSESGPSSQDQMLEFPSLQVYRKSSPVASEPKKNERKNKIPFVENVELVEQEASIEAPVPADPAPPSEEPTIKDPQNLENNMDNPKHPDVSSTPTAVPTKKRKCPRRREEMYLLAAKLLQEQQMRTKVETDSNIEHLCKLEDRQQLTPEPPVTPTPAPQLEHSASSVSITSPGASEGKTKKEIRIPFAENVKLVEQEVSIEPPVPADPAPPSEEPKIEDPQKKAEDPALPDRSSTTPRASKSSKKNKRRRRNKIRFPPMQEISSTLETDSSNKDQVMLLDLSKDPAVTPTPAPVSEHQAPATSFSSENVVSPQDGLINTPAEAFLQEEEMRSPECNVEDLCRMMDDPHLLREPWITLAPEPQRHHVVSNSLTSSKPMPILQPAPYVFKSPPAFPAFPEKEPEKEEMKSSPDSSIEEHFCRMLDEVHLSTDHWIPQTPAPVPQCYRLVSSSSTTSKPLLQPATFAFIPTTAFTSPEKKKKKKRSMKPEDSSVKDLCRKLKRLHLSRKHRDKPKPAPVPQHHLVSRFSQMISQPEIGLAQKEDMRSSSSVEELCRLLDGLHLSRWSNQHQLMYLP